MDLSKVKIVADSACDLVSLDGVDFAVAPLKIITAEKEYVDNSDLDVLAMVEELKSYRGKSSTSCPNASDWLENFGGAEYVFCVTITGGISGSYNAALVAKEEYEASNKNAKVFVLNTLSAGPEITLIIEELKRLILQGLEFDEVVSQITEYAKNTGLLFILESLQNFANNGRIKPTVAKIAGVLGIRVVGKASDEGTLEPLDKSRGEKKAIKAVIEHLEKAGLKKGRVKIAHCFNSEAVENLVHSINVYFPEAKVSVHTLRGLCSFYAEIGGILVGFEKN